MYQCSQAFQARGVQCASCTLPLGLIARNRGVLLLSPQVKGGRCSSMPAKAATSSALRAFVAVSGPWSVYFGMFVRARRHLYSSPSSAVRLLARVYMCCIESPRLPQPA